MKKICSSIIISFCCLNASGQVIPDSQSVDWSNPGYNGTIPDPENIVNVMGFGAAGNGTTNDYTAVTNAVNSLSGAQGVVYFPAGVYLIQSTVALPANVILRGASADSTTLKFNLGGASVNCIDIYSTQSGSFVKITSGFLKGSASITVSGAAQFSAGAYAEIRQQNGSWDTEPANWADYSVGQIIKITSVSGNNVSILKPLRLDYDTALGLEIRKITPVMNVGIECLNITRADDVVSGTAYNISFVYAANCWITGIESSKSVGAHIIADASANLQFTGNYIHDAYTYDGTGTRGYGITLIQHSSECLVENNIFKHLRHAMMVKQGANGNVFGYNYSYDPYRTEFPTDYGGDISLHGHYPFANLFEGNIAQNIYIDKVWGPSGPYNTFFRNRTELYGIIMTSGTVSSDKQNFVGNEITNTDAGKGSYILSGTDHFQYGNNWKNFVTPDGTGLLTDDSYYLSSQPPFWNVADTLPVIGYPRILNQYVTPAKSRFVKGEKLPICSMSDIVFSVEKLHISYLGFEIFPNPFSTSINIVPATYSGEEIKIAIYDIFGRIVYSATYTNKSDLNLHFPQSPPGMYYLKVSDAQNSSFKKIIRY